MSPHHSPAHAQRVKVTPNLSYKHDGLKSYVYALQKFSIEPTKPGRYQFNAQSKALVRAKADGTTGVVGASDQQNDSLYLCPVQIGTPPQTINLDFDSGSSDLWVWSTELPSSTKKSKGDHEVFDASQSSTFEKTSGSTWQISYGDGSSASGDVGTDNVTIGGITVEGQAVELAKTLSAQFTQSPGSGLLGLAFGTINTVKPAPVKTPVENMIAQQDIPRTAELFTAYLSSVKQQGTESFYTFGAIDQTTVGSDQVKYTPVDNSQGFWMFDSASFSVNGQTTQQSGNKAIADTGTTLALVSDAACQAIYGQIQGATYDQQNQGWVFPTPSDISSLPTVGFAAGDQIFTIHKEVLAFQDLGNGTSYGSIQSRGNNPFDILGDAWLTSLYAIFDVGNVQFGAVQRPDASASS